MLLTFPFGSYTDLMLPQSKKVSGLNPFLARIASWNCLRLISSEKGISISTHIIEEAANVFEEVIILKDKCVYLKENTVELLDKCRYVSGLEEDVKNAVDGCKIINEEHIGRSYAVTVMQDGDGKIKAVQHVTVQPVSLQNLFIAICGQSNM